MSALTALYELWALGIGTLAALAIIAILFARWSKTEPGQRVLNHKVFVMVLTAEFAFVTAFVAEVIRSP